MTIYLVELALIYIWGILFLQMFKSKKFFLIISFTTMAIVLGLRGVTVGEDTEHFSNVFKIVSTFSWGKILSGITETVYAVEWGVDRKIENGYILLNKLISVFTPDEQWMIFIVAVLTCGLFARFIYKNTKHVFLATQIFLCESLYMNSFNLMRQILAMAIAVNAYGCLKEKRYKRAAFIFLAAFLFHKSSIVLLVLYPLCMIKKNQKTVKYVAVGSLAVNIAVPVAAQIVSRLVPRYANYFIFNYWKTSVNGTMLLWLLEILLCTLVYFKGIRDKDTFVAESCTLLHLALDILGMRLVSFSRVALYFRSFLILFFPLCIPYLPAKRHVRLWYQVIVLAVLTAAFVSYAGSEARSYQFFWQ